MAGVTVRGSDGKDHDIGGPQFSPNQGKASQGTLFSNRLLNRAMRTGDEVGPKGYSENRLQMVRDSFPIEHTDRSGRQRVVEDQIHGSIARSSIPERDISKLEGLTIRPGNTRWFAGLFADYDTVRGDNPKWADREMNLSREASDADRAKRRDNPRWKRDSLDREVRVSANYVGEGLSQQHHAQRDITLVHELGHAVDSSNTRDYLTSGDVAGSLPSMQRDFRRGGVSQETFASDLDTYLRSKNPETGEYHSREIMDSPKTPDSPMSGGFLQYYTKGSPSRSDARDLGSYRYGRTGQGTDKAISEAYADAYADRHAHPLGATRNPTAYESGYASYGNHEWGGGSDHPSHMVGPPGRNRIHPKPVYNAVREEMSGGVYSPKWLMEEHTESYDDEGNRIPYSGRTEYKPYNPTQQLSMRFPED